MVEIALYQPEIPPNTGNIARTCAITGTKLHLIKPLGFSIDDRTLKRAGLDYWHKLDLEVHENLEAFLSRYGHRPIYPVTTKAKRYYHEMTYPDDAILLFGRETAGLPESIHRDHEATRIKIPMGDDPDLRSLNLSNAVNIVLYEALRQAGFPGLL